MLRALLRYIIQEEERPVFPPDDVRLLKEEPRKIEVLRTEQLEQLLAVFIQLGYELVTGFLSDR